MDCNQKVATDMLMQEPDEESTDEDDESEYTPPPSPSRTTTAVKRRSSQITLGDPEKKKIGVSLPQLYRASPEPVDLGKVLDGEESDEYMESDVGMFQPPKCDYDIDVVLSV
jgi:hypothetical protein